MTITVVMPTLNEAGVLRETLHHTAVLGFDQIIVVDGGSTDGTFDLVREALVSQPGTAGPSIVLLTSSPGRSLQMNAGAAAAPADVLLFLHADTRLPLNARSEIMQALQDPACVGGRFDVKFDRRTLLSHTIAGLMNRRSRWTNMYTGDQAIFVRADVFRRLNGFAPIPLMEDLEFSRRLKREGTTAALRAQVVTSYRRWEQQGPIRTILHMWWLRFLYWVGVNPETLVRHYRAVR